MPEHQQRRLVPEPHDEPARRVGLGREVGADVGRALLVLVHREQLDLVGGTGREVAQLEGRAVLPDDDVADRLLRLGERDDLELEAGVAARGGRVPLDEGHLAGADVDREVGRRIGR